MKLRLADDSNQRLRVLRVGRVDRPEGPDALLQVPVLRVRRGDRRVAAGGEQMGAFRKAVTEAGKGREPILYFVLPSPVVARRRRSVCQFCGAAVSRPEEVPQLGIAEVFSCMQQLPAEFPGVGFDPEAVVLRRVVEPAAFERALSGGDLGRTCRNEAFAVEGGAGNLFEPLGRFHYNGLVLAQVYDIVAGESYTVEIDPSRPRYYERAEGPLNWDWPMLEGFSKRGEPIVRLAGLAREFERSALAAFKAAVRGYDL